MRAIVPMKDMDRRLPEHGRIRLGEKGSKGQPQKIEVFRFTSHDKEAIAEIAALYGGTMASWPEKAGQWQVKTTAKVIPVVLPPDPLGEGPVYELWSGGGCLRRCDGETCLVPQQSASGAEMAETPCICDAKQAMECKPKTRLTVILPEVRFGGGWRLESGGWNVAQEMPGMVDMIAQLQTRGLSRAELALEERVSKFAGQTRKFVVPVLRPAVSVNVMLEGGGGVLALAPAPPEDRTYVLDPPSGTPLQEAPFETSWEQSDGVIVDAEIVEHYEGAQAPADTFVSEAVQKKRKKMHAVLKEIGMGNVERHALVARITNGAHYSSNDLDEGGLDMLLAALDAIKKGDAFYDGEDQQGYAIVSRR